MGKLIDDIRRDHGPVTKNYTEKEACSGCAEDHDPEDCMTGFNWGSHYDHYECSMQYGKLVSCVL